MRGLFVFAAPLWAQAVAPDVPEIAPAPAAMEKCDKCKEGGMGKMAHADGMQHAQKGCRGGMGAGDSAALERRIAELEKRLDQMQQLLLQPRKR